MPRKLTVICRAVSDAIDQQKCELTCIQRVPISAAITRKQHEAYVQVFRDLIKEGYAIDLVELPQLPELPDSMFVEDTAMMYDTCAILTRPGAASRQPEVDPIADAVKRVRPDCGRIVEPGTVDGGDVLHVRQSKYVFVGQSTRTNEAAFHQMKDFLGPRGLECVMAPVKGSLHLKCVASFLSADTVLIEAAKIDAAIFTSRGFRVVEADPAEPDSANALNYIVEKADGSGATLAVVVTPAAFPGTGARVKAFVEAENAAGRPTRHVVLEVDEIAKAEGALTCCSLLSYSE